MRSVTYSAKDQSGGQSLQSINQHQNPDHLQAGLSWSNRSENHHPVTGLAILIEDQTQTQGMGLTSVSSGGQ